MKTQASDISVFAKRIQQLRKERGWSQPKIGEMIGTSGGVIGRYERAEITPSVEVAQKFARVFGVSVDYLISEDDSLDILKDREMLSRLRDLEELSKEDRERVLHFADLVIRDAKARKAYGAN